MNDAEAGPAVLVTGGSSGLGAAVVEAEATSGGRSDRETSYP